MNNLSSYCGLTDLRMSASDTDLPVIYPYSLPLRSYLLDLSFGNEENVEGPDVCEVFLSLASASGCGREELKEEARCCWYLQLCSRPLHNTQCSGLKM